MEGLAWRLSRGTRWRLGGACPLREPAGRHTLTLRASLTARRVHQGRREALVTYYPPHVLEDEWVPEKEVTRIKRVEIASLPAHTKVILYAQFCASYRGGGPTATTTPVVGSPPRRPSRRCRALREPDCTEPSPPYREPPPPCRDSQEPRVTGAKKRKLGRRHGGDCFWPCGR